MILQDFAWLSAHVLGHNMAQRSMGQGEYFGAYWLQPADLISIPVQM